MKINLLTSTISFQKRFLTTATVLKRGRNYECNIYELDPTEDKDYFTKVERDNKWNNSLYLEHIIKDFPKDYPTKTTYSIENKKGECLGFVNVENDEEENCLGIDLIETCPKHTSKSKKREFKKIGTALINFLVNFAKENKFKAVTIPAVAKKARGFYQKYGFCMVYEDYIDAEITSDRYDDVLVENNIQSKRKRVTKKTYENKYNSNKFKF